MGGLFTKHECPAWRDVRQCRCRVSERVVRLNTDTTYLPHSNLIVIGNRLYEFIYDRSLGRHYIPLIEHVEMRPIRHWCAIMIMRSIPYYSYLGVHFIGSRRVYTLQRWVRKMLSRRRAVAVMMAAHVRLGAASELGAIGEDMLRLICAAPR